MHDQRAHKGDHRNSPFESIPRRLKMEFIYFVVLWLNTFPVKTGISAIYSPRERVVRWRLDYKKQCWVLPGKYCEAHDEPLPSKTTTTCTHECIACGPTGNLQGSVKCYCRRTQRSLALTLALTILLQLQEVCNTKLLESINSTP